MGASASHDGGGRRRAKCTMVKAGDAVPLVTFKCRVRDPRSQDENPFKWKNVTTQDLFPRGKRVVLFAVPGAFTPTCSTSHLPGYEDAYDAIVATGIDEVYCLSVNDAFVMRQWGLAQGLEEQKHSDGNPLNPGNFKKVKLIPDGACKFSRGMGATCQWESARGFGERSWRYSCVIADGVVERMWVEGDGVVHDSVDDPFNVSDAQTILTYLKETQART